MNTNTNTNTKLNRIKPNVMFMFHNRERWHFETLVNVDGVSFNCYKYIYRRREPQKKNILRKLFEKGFQFHALSSSLPLHYLQDREREGAKTLTPILAVEIHTTTSRRYRWAAGFAT